LIHETCIELKDPRGSRATSQPASAIACASVWFVAVAAFVNLLLFVLRTSGPVIRSDSWYFLDVFVSKAMDGSLGLSDFFVRRHGLDHAQPLVKLLLLIELRFFDLDAVVEALAGVLGAAACATAFYVLIRNGGRGKSENIHGDLAWATICAMLFSLNCTGIWTWPLVASGYVTLIPILFYMWAAWNAWHTQRYLLLTVATTILGVTVDDNAIVAVAVTLIVLPIIAVSDARYQVGHLWKVIVIVATCMVIVRVGYSYAPVVGETFTPPQPLAVHLSALFELARQGDTWKWVTIPLMMSVLPASPVAGFSVKAWLLIEIAVTVLLLISNALFWRKALRGPYNLSKYVAVCLMVLSYGWIISIVVYRVSQLGSSYLYQDRYVFIYQFNVVALLLMSAVGDEAGAKLGSRYKRLRQWLPALCCIVLIVLQIPFSFHAWQSRRYLILYYHQMAVQVEDLAKDPDQVANCVHELSICRLPLDRRRALIHLLVANHLNVFSLRVQKWHPFLPTWDDMDGRATTSDH